MTHTTPHPRTLEGLVTSDRMQKTRVVTVSRLKKHAKYLKYYKVSTNFKMHDEANESKTGDRVLMQESRPISKDKRWKLVKIIERGALPETQANTEETVPTP